MIVRNCGGGRFLGGSVLLIKRMMLALGAWMESQERGTHKESTGGGGVVLWSAVVVVARWQPGGSREGGVVWVKMICEKKRGV